MFCSCFKNQNKSSCSTKSKKYKVIFLLFIFVVIFILIIPMITQNYIDNKIKEDISILETIGLKTEISKPKGYFSSTRDVKITISDGVLVFTYLADKVQSNNLQSIIDIEDIDLIQLLNGTLLQGQLSTNNYFLSNPKLEISLSQFSNKIMEDIKNSSENSQIVSSWLDKGVFAASILFDFDGKIKKFALKDINEKINFEGQSSNMKITGAFFENNKISIEQLFISDENNLEKFDFKLNNLNSKIQNSDSLEGNLEELSINYNSKYEKLSFSSKNLTQKREKTLSNNKISYEEYFSMNDTSIIFDKDSLNIGKIEIKSNFNNLSKEELEVAMGDYKKHFGDVSQYTEYEINNAMKLINKGLIVKIDTIFDNISFQNINLGKLSILSDFEIKSNDLNYNTLLTDSNKIINAVEPINKNTNSLFEIKIDKKTIENLPEFKPFVEMLTIKNENNYTLILSKKENMILLNNKSIEETLQPIIGLFMFGSGGMQ